MKISETQCCFESFQILPLISNLKYPVKNVSVTVKCHPPSCGTTNVVWTSMQDPLRGGKDELIDYVVAFIHSGDAEALAKDSIAPPRKRLVPELLLKLAGKISPF